MEDIPQEQTLVPKETLESIKLVKNAKGDMQYEIKVTDQKLDDDTLKRLNDIRDKLETKYGKI